jgi:hypothetical protein
MKQPLGDIINALGCGAAIPEGFMPTDAIVLLAGVDSIGDECMLEGMSDGLSWIKRLGMLSVAGSEGYAVELEEDEGDDWPI